MTITHSILLGMRIIIWYKNNKFACWTKATHTLTHTHTHTQTHTHNI
jgi:hypothetical protein